MYYQIYEMNHAALQPFRAFADAAKLFYQNPLNPLSMTPVGRSVAAVAEVFERTTRRYGKPGFGFPAATVDGVEVGVDEKVVWSRPFCDLIHFRRDLPRSRRADPKLLIVAPMSGHYATLLRGTVEAMMQHAEVYITDWTDARMVPLSEGRFDLDDYVDYIIDMLHHLGPDTHVMAVCQPSVPVLAAVSVMEARGGGSIINIGSMAGRLGSANALLYSAVKAAVDGMTRSASVELGPKRIRVNSVAPSTIATEAVRAMLDETTFAARVASTPLGRIGEVDDIAQAALWLASPRSGFVTGQSIAVDGGLGHAFPR